jgi:hypothetical protein
MKSGSPFTEIEFNYQVPFQLANLLTCCSYLIKKYIFCSFMHSRLSSPSVVLTTPKAECSTHTCIAFNGVAHKMIGI